MAAGAIGTSLLMSGIRSIMGGHNSGSAHAAAAPTSSGASPWGGGSSGDLAKQAGLNDIGRSGDAKRDESTPSQGLVDSDSATNDSQEDHGDDGDFEDDGGSDGDDE
jgi:hypothetical protein